MGQRKSHENLKKKKNFQMNANEDTTYQILWNETNAVVRGKYSFEFLHYKRRKVSNQ